LEAVPAQIQGQPVYILKENVSRSSGEEVLSNILSVSSIIGEVIKTSMGPKGLNKMLIGSFGDITYSKSGLTILSEANIEHPIGKLYVEAAKTIDKNEGDGSSRLVFLVSRLVHRGAELYAKGIHPAVVAQGYSDAVKFSTSILEKMARDVDPTDEKTLRAVIRTIILPTLSRSDMQLIDKFTDLILEAVRAVSEKGNGKMRIDPDNVTIVSKAGGDVSSSSFIDGLIIEKEVVHPNMPVSMSGARIAIIDFPLEVKKTEISSELEFTNPQSVVKLKAEERKSVVEKIEKIIESGANVLVSQKGIDDSSSSSLAKAGILAVKNVKRSDIEKLAKATGGKIISYHPDMDSGNLGNADIVEERRFENEKVLTVEGGLKSKSVSILVRGVNKELMKENERAIKKALAGVQMLYAEPKVVPTGVADFVEVSIQTKRYASKKKGELAIVVEAYSDSLMDIPQAIADNSGMKVIKTLGDLRAAHSKKGGTYIGLDSVSTRIVDSKKERILEPIRTVRTILNAATELASILLRIDDMLLSVKMPEKKQQE